MENTHDYKSNIGPRETFVRRTVTSVQSSTPVVRSFQYSSAYGGGLAGLSALGAHPSSELIQSREKEKKDLQELNDRLANYIEKVRFLEAQNRKLSADLDGIRGKWGSETSQVKLMYEKELAEARKLIDETAKNKAQVEIKVARLTEDLAEARRKYDEINQTKDADKDKVKSLQLQLANSEGQNSYLKQRLANAEDELDKLRKSNQQLLLELTQTRSELDQETLSRIDYQNQVQTLIEEIEFLRRTHDQELKELQLLAAQDSTAENREFFKNELGLAIRDIRNEYESIANRNRADLETYYKVKIQEVTTSANRNVQDVGAQKEEVKTMRTQMSSLRTKLGDLETKNATLANQLKELTYQLEEEQRMFQLELNNRDAQIGRMSEESQSLLMEMQMLLDTKQTLDAEIAIYRKILEGEENAGGLKQLAEHVVKTYGVREGFGGAELIHASRSESAVRTSIQRSAKGNIAVNECDPEGKFITIENTNRTADEYVNEWQLKRSVDGGKEIVFTFPTEYLLKAGQSVTIYAKNGGSENAPADKPKLVMEQNENWGVGQNVKTVLYNKEGEEKATHTQRKTQQSF